MSRTRKAGSGSGHCPTPSTRLQVATLKAFGDSDAAIARSLNVGVPTLRRFYHQELEHGPERIRQGVTISLMKDVLTGKDQRGRLRIAEELGIINPKYRLQQVSVSDLPPPGQRHAGMLLGDEESRGRINTGDEEELVFKLP